MASDDDKGTETKRSFRIKINTLEESPEKIIISPEDSILFIEALRNSPQFKQEIMDNSSIEIA